MMRVLAFNWRDRTHPQAGGAEKNIHELGKRMVDRGHEFILFCGMYRGAKREETMDGFRVIRGGSNYSVYLSAIIQYLLKLRSYEPDVIIDDINGLPFFTPIYTRRPRIGLFHHRVGEIFKKELPFPLCHVGMFIENHLVPFFYSNSEMVTVSPSSMSDLVVMGFQGDRIHVVHNGVDSRTYTPGNGGKSDQPLISYVGRLKRYKRLDILLRVVDELKEELPDLQVSIAGKGDDSDRLKTLSNDLAVEDRVEFLGFVSKEEKVELLQRSWAFAMPSEREGWGITSLEANACGTPVIAFDVPGLRDSVSHGRSGFLVKDEVGFQDAILTICRDATKRAELSKSAREWCLQFDWDVSAEKMISILGRVAYDGGSTSPKHGQKNIPLA